MGVVIYILSIIFNFGNTEIFSSKLNFFEILKFSLHFDRFNLRDQVLLKWIKRIFDFSMAPVTSKYDLWDGIMINKPNVSRIDEFLDFNISTERLLFSRTSEPP